MKGTKGQEQLAGTKKSGKTREQPGTQQNDAESRGQCPLARAQHQSLHQQDFPPRAHHQTQTLMRHDNLPDSAPQTLLRGSSSRGGKQGRVA